MMCRSIFFYTDADTLTDDDRTWPDLMYKSSRGNYKAIMTIFKGLTSVLTESIMIYQTSCRLVNSHEENPADYCAEKAGSLFNNEMKAIKNKFENVLEQCKDYRYTLHNIDKRIDDADVRKKSRESTSHSEFANFVADMIKTEYPFVDAVVMVYDDLSGIYWHAGHYMVYRWRRDGKNLRILIVPKLWDMSKTFSQQQTLMKYYNREAVDNEYFQSLTSYNYFIGGWPAYFTFSFMRNKHCYRFTLEGGCLFVAIKGGSEAPSVVGTTTNPRHLVHTISSDTYVTLFARNLCTGKNCDTEPGVSPSKNNLIESIDAWGPSFYIKFDVKFLSLNRDNVWRNVLRFSGYDGNCCKIGQRFPALFTHPGSLYSNRNLNYVYVIEFAP